jgi:DNA-binding PadR family transcriptional regulator
MRYAKERVSRRGHHEHHRSEEPPHGGRLRHGDVRAALLLALQEAPAHGYEIGRWLERASGGNWRPSPGSIYPTLQSLADAECVSFEDRDGKRIYSLTKKGQAEIRERQARGEALPWQSTSDGKGGALREAVVGLKMAAKQIGAVGSSEQQTRAVEIVVDARRRLYELLAKG